MSRYCLKCTSSPWQWSKLSPVVWPHLSSQSVCTSEVHVHWIPGEVQVSLRCREGHCVLWLPKNPPRLQTASAAFLTKQSKNMVTPFVLATLSRKAHQRLYGGAGGWLDRMVLFPDNVFCKWEDVLHLAASTQSWEISCICNSFPPIHQQTGIIPQPRNFIYTENCRIFLCWNFTSFVRI